MYASKPGALYKPKPECNTNPDFDCPEGSTRNGFFKVYGNNLAWRFLANTSDNDRTPIFVDFTQAGRYEMIINARSSFHRIDRTVLYHSDVTDEEAQQLTNAETQCMATGEVTLTFLVSDGFEAYENATVVLNDGDTLVTQNTDTTGRTAFTRGAGTYAYTVMAEGRPDLTGNVSVGADRTVLVTLPWVTKVPEPFAELNFSVFPNPATNRVTIAMPTAAEASVRLFDGSGRMVRSLTSGSQQFGLDLLGLPGGVYAVEVKTEAAVGRRKLVIR